MTKRNTPKVPILKEVNFGKMQLCRVEHLLNTFSTYLSSKLDSTPCNQNIGEGESNIDDKYVEKVFNKCSTRQSCIFPKFTSYRIGTLVIKILVNPSHTLTNFNHTALENVDVTTYILHPLQCQCQCRSLHCYIA